MRRLLAAIFVCLLTLMNVLPAEAQMQIPVDQIPPEIRSIIFPVIGPVSYYDDFGQPRGSGTHHGNDLMGRKGQMLVAAVDGTVSYVVSPQASWGYSITLRDKDGFRYQYIHMNNDTPRTDDGKGGEMNAYARTCRRRYDV